MTIQKVHTKNDIDGRQASSDTSGKNSGLAGTLLRAAWLAILLGMAMEGLLLLTTGLGAGSWLPVADLVKNVSWSVFVCVGLAVGTAASKARVPIMGALGLFTAPLAFEASRALHKGTLEALSVAGGPETLSPYLVAVLKGLEYGALGIVIGWVGKRSWGGAAAHASAGLAVGVLFGGTILGLMYSSSPQVPQTADLLSKGLNEVLFPVGCALVLFAAEAMAGKVKGR